MDNLDKFKRYEVIRQGGQFNMFSEEARIATGLSKEDYIYVMENYTELKRQAEGDNRKLEPVKPNVYRRAQECAFTILDNASAIIDELNKPNPYSKYILEKIMPIENDLACLKEMMKNE